MAQYRVQRGGRPQKRHRAKHETRSQAVAEDEKYPAAVKEDTDSGTDEEGDTMNAPRPFNTLLDLFNVGSERRVRKAKRRKIRAERSEDLELSSTRQDTASEHTSASDSAGSDVDESEDAPEVSEDDSDEEIHVEPAEQDDEAHDDPFIARIDAPDQTMLNARIERLKHQGWASQRLQLSSQANCVSYSPKDTTVHNQLVERRGISTLGAGMKKKLEDVAAKVDKQASQNSKLLVPYIFGYNDVLYGARTPHNAADLQQLACLHILNHLLKTRDRVLKHNTRLANSKEDNIVLRDQGFTRPKVLFLLPTRGACVKIVEILAKLSQIEQQENRKRFDDGFQVDEAESTADRPDDFKDIFAGNTDDMFRMGIKFTRKTMKFFSPFYNSDVILASPLGLRNAIDGEKGKKPDYDFLSSIEIVVIDQADALLMQNWEHVSFVMEHLNLSPKEAHECDFSRVRMWYLDDQAKYLRQTICLSSFVTPEINTLFNKHMLNVFGKIKYQAISDGTVLTTGLPIKQTFSRYASTNILSDPDARFNFFTSTIIPWMLRQPRPADGGLGILIFIPSYFDFIRVKNYFTTSPAVTSLSFATVTEHHTPAEPETRRARSHFLTGKSSVLIYTGRAHHFYRYMIKGVKHVVMYQLPDNPIFYCEIVAGFLGASVLTNRIAAEEGSARVLFSKWDALRLERVVGTERVRTMMGSGDTFDFI